MIQKKYEELLNVLKTYYEEEDLKEIDGFFKCALKVYEDKKRYTGEDYFNHPLNVALLLAGLKMDIITIGSALLHESMSLEKLTYDEIKEKFGEETADIISGITKISGLKRTFKNENNIERYRKIIVGLSDNPKIIFIKLADRLDNLKTLYVHPEDHQKEIVEETEKVFIPIAHRLGIKKFKSEMEDLCLRNSHPKEYEEILTQLKDSREKLEEALKEMKNNISEILTEHNIDFTITSRVKSVRGIFNKLSSGKKWNEIYDMLGIRVLVNNLEECYLVLGHIHSKYKSLPKRFKDYIANPKSNMYQSLHTTIFGVGNYMYEVQVRTYDMDEIAERGIASHWSYKEHINGKIKSSLDLRLEEFKTLIEINDIEGNLDFFQNLNKELVKEEIYIFTPKGDVIELPKGSTPIDFAYKIHTEVGNTAVGALVNNKMEKLDYVLSDGDMVSLITQTGREPNKAWLKFVKTENARGRIKSYFFKKEKEKILKTAKELLETEIKKKNLNLNDTLSNENIERISKELELDSIEDLYFGLSSLKYTPSTIINKLLNIKETPTKEELLERVKPKTKIKNNVIIAGDCNILTNIASCCSPIKGEEIIGYVTKGEGVSIHRKDCKNIDLNCDRIIEACWGEECDSKYQACLNIYTEYRSDKLSEIVALASKHEINIEYMNLKKSKESYYELRCRVKDIDALNIFISDLKKFKFINKVERTCFR